MHSTQSYGSLQGPMPFPIYITGPNWEAPSRKGITPLKSSAPVLYCARASVGTVSSHPHRAAVCKWPSPTRQTFHRLFERTWLRGRVSFRPFYKWPCVEDTPERCVVKRVRSDPHSSHELLAGSAKGHFAASVATNVVIHARSNPKVHNFAWTFEPHEFHRVTSTLGARSQLRVCCLSCGGSVRLSFRVPAKGHFNVR